LSTPEAAPLRLEEPPCDACGATAYRVLFENQGDLHAEAKFVATTDQYGGYGRVVACTSCGLARLHPRQKWDFLEHSYEDSEDPLYLEQLPGRLASARRVIRLLEREVPPGRLLDIGCGVGVVLQAASPAWTATGVEPSKWAAKHARETFHLNVIEGSVEDTKFPDASFDAVTMLDVIEHLADPRHVLAEVHRILRPGGVFYIYTPDLSAPVARLMGRWWWGLRAAHLYYFSGTTLPALLRDLGYEVRFVRHIGRRFTFGYWLSRMTGYAPRTVAVLLRLSKLVWLDRLPLYVNTFDSMGVLARKKAASPQG